MSGFIKVAGYKIGMKKFVAFLYTNNEISEKDISFKFLLKSHFKKIKHLGVNLTKEVRNVYTENCKNTDKGK